MKISILKLKLLYCIGSKLGPRPLAYRIFWEMCLYFVIFLHKCKLKYLKKRYQEK